MTDVIPFSPRLEGMVPPHLAVRSAKIHLDGLAVMTDIGFHDFEVGTPQRLLISVEVWLDEVAAPDGDLAVNAWNYDHLRLEVERIASSRRFNLQETLVREIYDWIAARAGVSALRVGTSKPDVYPNARGVGVEIASFSGSAP
ncbi:dihydroneopterin aldolase [Sphingomonas kaistensis]|uniref:dihydroneopterin aldolase n=1 Tax=Sphingomonas kaistensis TaxID=298708 RepID=A0A7X5Y8V6_9SPHN|nr:dihydroneopterin aldolase [Sphingomonas kaistensis]NJC06707.1 dihydroneopterin aldolase [Sphingomonas kaistensis]